MAEGVSRLIGRGATYSTAAVVQNVSRLFAIPFVTRLLPVHEFGLAATSFIVMYLVAGVATLGLPHAIVRNYFASQDGPEQSRLLVGTSLVTACLVAALAYVTGPVWSGAFSEIGYGSELKLATIGAVPIAAGYSGQAWLRAADAPRRYLASVILSSTGSQLLGLLVIARFGPTATRYIAGVVVGAAAGAALSILWSKPRFWPLRSKGVRSALRLTVPTVPHQLSAVLLASGDRFVIERMMSLSAVGRYQVAYGVGAVGLGLFEAVYAAWPPLIHEEEPATRWTLLRETIRLLTVMAGIGVVIVAAVAPFVLRLLAPTSYLSESLPLTVSLIALSVLPMIVAAGATIGLVDKAGTSAMMWIGPLSVVANIAMNLLLIPGWGLSGAAVATFSAYGLSAGLASRQAKRVGVHMWPNPGLFSVWAVAAISAIVVSLAPVDGLALILRAALTMVLLVTFIVIGRQHVRALTGRS